MRVSIFGLGYVGCVCMACLAESKHTVLGVDIDANKVRLLNSGKPTVVENKLEELLSKK